MNATCENCPFYCALENQCRESSPAPLPIPRDSSTIKVMGMWPAVLKGQWCGKHPWRARLAQGLQPEPLHSV
jgi:hypothetical protein